MKLTGKIKGGFIVVVRINSNNELRNSKPCDKCEEANDDINYIKMPYNHAYEIADGIIEYVKKEIYNE